MFITVLMIKSTKRSVGVCHVITVTIVVDMNTHVHGLSYFLSPGTVIEKKKKKVYTSSKLSKTELHLTSWRLINVSSLNDAEKEENQWGEFIICL